jgi:hypothetical protein
MSDYETDVYRWSERQDALLRRLAAGERVNDADLDWPNIAEEIETVGRSERAALSSHIGNVLEHLIKLQIHLCRWNMISETTGTAMVTCRMSEAVIEGYGTSPTGLYLNKSIGLFL